MKFIMKKSHKILAVLLSFLSTFTLSIMGKQSVAEVKTGVSAKKTSNLPPASLVVPSPIPPAFKPYVASDSSSPTPPAFKPPSSLVVPSPVPSAFRPPDVTSDSTSQSKPPPSIFLMQAADNVEAPMEDNLQSFVNSDIQVPPADALESDELFQANPALYRVMVENMQMQILMLNQIEFLKTEVTDLKSQVKTLKSGAPSTKTPQ